MWKKIPTAAVCIQVPWNVFCVEDQYWTWGWEETESFNMNLPTCFFSYCRSCHYLPPAIEEEFGTSHDTPQLSLATGWFATILPGCWCFASHWRRNRQPGCTEGAEPLPVGSSHPMLPPLTRAPHVWERLCWGGRLSGGPHVMTALPGCSAVLWLLPTLPERNCPAKPQAAFCIAKGAVQECEGGGCKGRPLEGGGGGNEGGGGGNTTTYLSTTSKSA